MIVLSGGSFDAVLATRLLNADTTDAHRILFRTMAFALEHVQTCHPSLSANEFAMLRGQFVRAPLAAIGGAQLGADSISAEFDEVLGGVHPVRINAEQITGYGWTRLPRRCGRVAHLPSGAVATIRTRIDFLA